MELRVVPSRFLRGNWRSIKKILQTALPYSGDTWTLESIYKDLKDEYCQLWVAINDKYEIQAVCVTKIVIYPTGKRLSIVVVAGFNIQEWISYFKAIERFAEDKGCDIIEFVGRPGWERMLKRKGFHKTHIVMRYIIGE